jgi:hypothetical protein
MTLRDSILVLNLYKYILSAEGTRVYYHHLLTQTMTSSLEGNQILFSTQFQYTNGDGKFKHAYAQPFFHKVVYTRYDILMLLTADRLHQSSSIWKLLIPLLRIHDSYRLGPVRNKGKYLFAVSRCARTVTLCEVRYP